MAKVSRQDYERIVRGVKSGRYGRRRFGQSPTRRRQYRRNTSW